MAKLCLNMIVKNEAHIIEETLRLLCSKFPIDYWVISDTGSTDETAKIIEKTFLDLKISGELHHETWQNFGDNRQLALDHASGKADNILFFDADDTIKGEPQIPDILSADAYYANFISSDGSTAYRRILMIKDGKAKWRGVLHEFIEMTPNSIIEDITGDFQVVSRRLGSRSKNPNKYLDDALLLVKAIEEGRDIDLQPRYLFYCAQSYRDAQMNEQAKYWYLKRAQEEKGWIQERYISYLNLGFICESENEIAQAFYYWGLATKIDPTRKEAWYHQARLHRWKNNFDLAYLFAKRGASANERKEKLFISEDIYTYWMHYENFILACEFGEYEHAYDALKQLIYSNAPQYLYLNQAEKIQKLSLIAQKDSLVHIKEFLHHLNEHSLSQIAQWLNIHVS